MKILYLASSSDWHIDLWTQYFTKQHSVYLFSDKDITMFGALFEESALDAFMGKKSKK